MAFFGPARYPAEARLPKKLLKGFEKVAWFDVRGGGFTVQGV